MPIGNNKDITILEFKQYSPKDPHLQVVMGRHVTRGYFTALYHIKEDAFYFIRGHEAELDAQRDYATRGK